MLLLELDTPEEIEAAREKQLFGEVKQTGINYEVYNRIDINFNPNDVDPTTGEKIPELAMPSLCNTFEEMKVCSLLKDNIRRMNYKIPTPVQKAVVPLALLGRDLISTAQTGSGKSAAYLIPIIEKCMSFVGAERRAELDAAAGMALPLALILAPTRELSVQIQGECDKFTFKMPLKSAVAYGGPPRGVQIKKIIAGCDILIATPGRLKDFIENKVLSLRNVKAVVLDEADRLLDMGFKSDIENFLLNCEVPVNRQMMMFSATFEDAVKGTAESHLRTPAFVNVGRIGSTTDLITQQLVEVEDYNKREKLMELIMEHQAAKRMLVFVERKSTAVDLDRYLDGAGIYACSIHGDRDQESRQTALNNFARGLYFLMIATDVAARGLDIDGIDVVVNFDMPRHMDTYTHRIGRTGRAGRKGLAISFINSTTNKGVLENVKTLMSETQQQTPDWLDKTIESAGLGRGGGGGGGGGGCRQWTEGTCTRGDECKFAHEGEAPEGSEAALAGREGRRRGGGGGGCRQWTEGTCTRGDGCKFAHEGEAPEGSEAALAGREGRRRGGGGGGCRQWTEGTCTRGDRCKFAHEGESGGGGSRGGGNFSQAGPSGAGDFGGTSAAAPDWGSAANDW